jgi:hypothetical protein
MNAPIHWDATPYRGCSRCQHGRDANGQAARSSRHEATTCVCDEVGRGVPVARARAVGGACGPEAHHLNFPGFAS